MSRRPRIWSAVALLLFAHGLSAGRVPAQGSSPPLVDLEIPVPPVPARADGKIHLFYELHVTNFGSQRLELTGVEIYGDGSRTNALARYRDAELRGRLVRPGIPPASSTDPVIGGGLRAIVFLELTVAAERDLPRSLQHRLTFKPDAGNAPDADKVVDGAVVSIQRNASLVLAPPLRGERWLAANGPSNTSVHRRAILTVAGKARIAQRFAIDWIKLGADGRAFHSDPAVNANWYGYGAEVRAVSDATVAQIKDGVPENVPLSDKRAVPITLQTLGGNYVLLDLGRRSSALYAHLQPGSLRVKPGDRIKRGQVLGLLGNSGNSDAPHLHIHVTDASSPFGSEGVPYVFDSFELQGAVTSLGELVGGRGWTPPANGAVNRRRLELPLENAIVRFP